MNRSFSAQTNAFHATFSVTPSLAFLDGVVGLSPGSADQFTDLAAIVRFNPAGRLDARDGGSYRAFSSIPYSAGKKYSFELDLDVPSKSYSATVTPAGGVPLELARNYAFRSQQSAASRLDDLGAFVDSSAGRIEICDFSVSPASSSTCQRVAAGDGFLESAFQQQMGSFAVEFDVTPSSSNMDGLVGLQKQGGASFASLAAIVRFNPSGVIDARNGGAYAADAVMPYSGGATFHVRMSVNLAAHRYSVWVTPAGSSESALATDYQFRTEQAQATALDRVTRMVDSATGYLDVCDFRVTTPPGQLEYLSGFSGNLALDSAARLVISGPGRSQTLDGDGRLVAEAPYGGLIVVDRDDSRAIAGVFSDSISLGGGPLVSAGAFDVYVARYTSEWGHVFSRRLGTSGDDDVSELAGDGHGALVLTGAGIGTVKLGVDGQTLWENPLAGVDVAMDSAGNVIVIGDFDGSITIGPTTHSVEQSGIYLAKFDAAGGYVFSRAFAARDNPDPASGRPGARFQRAHHVAADPGGNILFSGVFVGAIGFGGPELFYPGSGGESPPTKGFLVKLDGSGSHLYSVSHWFERPADLVTDASGNAALTGRRFNPMPFMDLLVVRSTGEPALYLNGPTDFGNGRGFPVDVALDASGFVYWSGSAERFGAQGIESFPFSAKYTF